MFRKLQPAWIITRREVRDQFRDWRIIIPIFVLTLIFPSLMNFTASQASNFVARYGAEVVGERLIPFLLMVVGFFPISVSLVIALESFVGEKERRSIEPLLASPLNDWQLYLGKLVAVMVPPMVASYLGIVVYLVGVYRQVGWLPTPVLLVQILLLTFVQALVMVSGAVVISTQATSVRAANLLASFIIIPMAFLIQGESMVMFWARYPVLWWVIFGLALVAGLLVRTGVSHFNREELLGRELDTLNLKGAWKTFRSGLLGQARSLGAWYRVEVFGSLRRMVVPLILVAFLLGLGVYLGMGQARVFPLPKEVFDLGRLRLEPVGGLDRISFLDSSGVALVWFHNARVMVIALVLGLISFGVFGLVVLMLPMLLLGYLMANLAAAGITPGQFLLGLILPHGIFEIPAIILSGATLFQMGARIAAPWHGRSISEAWLSSLADWVKIFVGLVLPLLLLAAVMEVFVTPGVALRVLSR